MTPISELHASLAEVERSFDAARLNAIVNDPSVYPWVSGGVDGALDLTKIVAHPSNVLLLGEHGGVLFIKQQPGIYEAHTQVLPAGRGEWTERTVRSALHFMFTRTDAVEVMTRCPQGNIAAIALTKRMGLGLEFTNPAGWTRNGKTVAAHVYALRIQDWMRHAPGLAERGRWFIEKLVSECARFGVEGRPDNAFADRYVGAAWEMMTGGAPNKAAVFYNRWALLSGYDPISIINSDPLTIDIEGAILIVKDGDFWVASCRGAKE